MQAPERDTASGASALPRLVGRWDGGTPRPPGVAAGTGLAHWLGWTDAIALAAVLDGAEPAPVARRAPQADPLRASGRHETPETPETPEERDHARVRAILTQAIDDARAGAAADPGSRRWRHAARQQAMETAIAALRGRLRRACSERSAALARLAALDAVLEAALAARERRVLAALPGQLEHQSSRATTAAPGARDAAAVAADALAEALHAELDLRMQPVHGLLDALRSAP